MTKSSEKSEYGSNYNEQLKKSIIKTRNAIKKKFREMHNQKLAISERVNETFKPIIEPLKTLAAETKRKQQHPYESKWQYDQTKNIKNEKLMGAFGTNTSVFKTALPPHRRGLFPTSSAAATASASNSPRPTSGKHNISGFWMTTITIKVFVKKFKMKLIMPKISLLAKIQIRWNKI